MSQEKSTGPPLQRQSLKVCFRREHLRNNPLKIIPDKCFPFTFDEKEKWHFFLVEEDFVYEHLCFFFADYAEAVKFFKSVDN